MWERVQGREFLCYFLTIKSKKWTHSIWLLDADKLFRSPSMTYQGFDISGLQFPAEIPQGLGQITFSEQDIVKPFPTEHVGKYDVVHVRLLVQALKEEDVETAVWNVAALLRMFVSTYLLIYKERAIN
jgi:hypothetical protein